MKKLLVTGGAGFIGSAFIRRAIVEGYSVVNLDALTYAASKDALSGYDNSEQYHFLAADICDREVICRVLASHRPDAVVHFAAESHVDRSIQGPLKFIETNILGTGVLLESCRDYLNKRANPNFKFIHISTDEVFGSLSLASGTRFNESTPYTPNSPYSASKAASDHLVRAWIETYNFPAVITNCSNNYGPFQFPEKLIPVTIINALHGKEIPIYGTGENVRDWLYVDDHVSAVLKILESFELGESFCIGGDSECSNLELVQHICNALQFLKPTSNAPYSDLITFVADRPGHDLRYAIDASKLRTQLGWSPSISLVDGLQATVQWYLESQWWWGPLLGSTYND